MEVVVVAGVLLVVGSLLLPGVNTTRTPSGRTVCMNNQRNVALAIIHHVAARRVLPGWAEPQVPWSENASPRPISWVYPILPHLDRDDIHRAFGEHGRLANLVPGVYPETAIADQKPVPTDELHLRVLVCPNDTTALGQGANMSYVVNAGLSDGPGFASRNLAGLYAPGEPHAGSTYREDAASGVFHNQYWVGHPDAKLAVAPATLEQIWDGTGQTLMLSENLDAGKWIDANEGAVAFCWFPVDSATARDPRFDLGVNRAVGEHEGHHPRPSSHHPDGFIATFCDGHSTLVDQAVDHVTWSRAFTPRGASLKFGPHDVASPTPPTDLSETLFAPLGYQRGLQDRF